QPTALQPVRVRVSMGRDFFADLSEIDIRGPTEIAMRAGIIHDDPRYVIGARPRIGRGMMRAESRIAPCIEVCNRCSIARSATGGVTAISGRARGAHLTIKQLRQVACMQYTAHLLAIADEAGITQFAARPMRMNPVGHDALTRRPKLPCARHYAATVHPHW